MKIFTLLQNLLKMLTGPSSRNVAFNTPNAERETRNAQRGTPDVQHPIAPLRDASVSVEYKILPVQKKIPVQKIKPVFMQNFFAIVKKIFSLSDHPKTLLENLNDGYHPGCHYGTAGNENISRTNQHHDVANPAASFALIPIALTPTAMNHQEKKSVKTITGRSGMFGIIMLMSSLFFVSTALGQATKTWALTSGGTWGTANNWSPSGAPAANDNVIISGNLSSAITGVPTISLTNLTINGNCNFTGTNGPTITVTGTFSVPAGVGFSLGTGGTSTPRVNLTLSSTSVGSVLGTVNINTGGTDVTFTNSGNLTITLSTGATLQIGSTAGITTSTTTGNIRVDGTRTYSAGASYIYNGTAAQAAGNALPGTISNLTISNSAGVTLAAAKNVTTNLSITTGSVLNLGTFTHTAATLTLGGVGTVNGSWGSTTSSATHKNDIFFAATTGIVNVTTSTCTPPAAPTVTSPVSYCIGSTASQLTATGSNLLWYAASTGGSGSATAPTPVITSVGTIGYFVSQTIGCEGPRAEIDVVVNPTPSTTVNGSTNITCNGANDGTITIAVNGGTPDYFFSVDGGNTYTLETHPSPYIFPGLSANTPYTIRVKDTKGCQSQTF